MDTLNERGNFSKASGEIQGKELRPSLHLGVVAIEKGAFL